MKFQRQQSEAMAKVLLSPDKVKITKVKPPFPVDNRGCWFVRDTGAGGEVNQAKWMHLAKQTPFDADPDQKARFLTAIKDKVEKFDELPKEAGRFWDCMQASVDTFTRLATRDDLIGGTGYIVDNATFLRIGLKQARWLADKKTFRLAILYLEHFRGYCLRDSGVTASVMIDDETKPHADALKDAQAQLDDEERDEKLSAHVSQIEATFARKLDAMNDKIRKSSPLGKQQQQRQNNNNNGGSSHGSSAGNSGGSGGSHGGDGGGGAKRERPKCGVCHKWGHSTENHRDDHKPAGADQDHDDTDGKPDGKAEPMVTAKHKAAGGTPTGGSPAKKTKSGT